MAIEPAQGILYGHMEVPEGIVLRNLDPSPDGRAYTPQGDFELIDFPASPCHALWSPLSALLILLIAFPVFVNEKLPPGLL